MRRSHWILILLVLSGTTMADTVTASATDYALIAGPGVLADDITMVDARRLFQFETKAWPGGTRAGVLLPSVGSKTRSVLLRHVYRLSDPDLRQMILTKLYQGAMDVPPRVTASDHEAAGFVNSTRGLIALVETGVALESGAHILRVDGKKPGDAGYPLKD